MFSKTLLPLVLLALSLTTPINSAAVRRSKCKPPPPKPVKDGIYKAVDGSGKNFYPGISKLNGNVEGASVDLKGNIYAVDNLNFIALHDQKTDFVPITVPAPPKDKDGKDGAAVHHFASSRHTRTLGVLFGNAVGKEILVTKGDGKFTTFVKDDDLVQPNDFTLDASESRIFYTGQTWQPDSVVGEDGAVGCIDVASKKVTRVPTETLVKAGTFRINGIDLSPDDKYLYVTNQRNVNGTSEEQKVFRFKVPETGCDLGEPEEWADLNKLLATHGIVDDKKAMDPDGLRTDDKGRVYVALNAFGRVMKIHTPELCEIIETPNIENPSNLEFGMEKGDHIVVVGRCVGGGTTACVSYLGVDATGRAFKNLNAGGNGTEGKGGKGGKGGKDDDKKDDEKDKKD